jgi:divalent metal cation (Fe/Co/Zn/Cd) transporter
VTEVENRVRAALEDIVEVVTHIEPGQAAGAEEAAEDEEAEWVRAQTVAVGDRVCGRGAAHHITLRRLDGRYDVSLHVIAPGESSVVEAHLLAEEVERQLRETIAGLERVTVHVEPPEGRDD